MINLNRVMMDSIAIKDPADCFHFINQALKEYRQEELDAEKSGTYEEYVAAQSEAEAYWESLCPEERQRINAEERKRSLDQMKAENECEELLEHVRYMMAHSPGAPHTQDLILLSAFRDEYCALFKGKHADSTIATKRDSINALIGVIGDVYIHEVKAKTADTFFARKQERNNSSPVYLNALLRSLRPVFQQAVRWEYLSNNPFKGIAIFPEWDEEKRKHLTPDELHQIITLIPEVHRAYREIFLFLANTGIRREELIRLKWMDVSVERREITVRKSKTHRSRFVPLSDAALSIIECMRSSANGPYVFHIRGRKRNEDHVSKEFLKYRRLAGLDKKITLHSLRHMAATVMRDAGKPMEVISNILGHCNTKVTQDIYVHQSTESMHDAIKALDIIQEANPSVRLRIAS